VLAVKRIDDLELAAPGPLTRSAAELLRARVHAGVDR
jgi:hypothetical protein